MIVLDGNYGEGGGQIVRTALALSALTGKPFEIDNIRKGRCRAGLKNQHLYAIKTLSEICDAKAEGVKLGSEKIRFFPSAIKAGDYKVDIRTAGSITLVLQALLLPLIFADKKSSIRLKGGTSGKWAAPIDFFRYIILPQIKEFYEDIEVNVEKRGYYPAGGGKVKIKIKPRYKLTDDIPEFNLTEQGELISIEGISHASKELEKAKVAERQARAAKLALKQYQVKIKTEYCETLSTGSGITLWANFSNSRIGSDSLGERGKRAEIVGKEAAERLVNEINYKAPIDEHLADNLIPFLALSKGKIRVAKLSNHTLTNIYVVEKFLDVKFNLEKNLIQAK